MFVVGNFVIIVVVVIGWSFVCVFFVVFFVLMMVIICFVFELNLFFEDLKMIKEVVWYFFVGFLLRY